MGGGQRVRFTATVVLSLAAGQMSACTSYSREPLESDPATLSTTTQSILSRDSDAFVHLVTAPASIDLSRPLDLNAVATIAVLGNPDLKALRVRYGVANAQLFAAGLLPDPTFSLGASQVLSGPDPFLDIAGVLGLDVSQLRTRSVRITQARARAQQVRLDVAWAEWQVAGQAQIEAIRIGKLERQSEIAALSRTAANLFLERTLRAAGRGDIAADQIQTARIAAFDATERERTIQRDLAAARLELSKLLGLPPSYEIRLAPLDIAAPTLNVEKLFAIARDHRADLAALRAGYEAQEAAVHKAVLDQFPNLGLTINGNRDSGGNLKAGPAISFTLPLWNRNRGTIAVEQATRAALRAEYDARLFQARAQIAEAISGIRIAMQQRDAAIRDLPALRAMATASRRAANRGDLSLATADAAEQVLRDKLLIAAQTEQAIGEQIIALELLTGSPSGGWQ